MVKYKYFVGIIILCFLVVSYLKSTESDYDLNDASLSDSLQIDSSTIHIPKTYLGINVDSLNVKQGKIHWNQNLTDLLKGHNVNFEKINQLSIKAKNIYDVKRLKAKTNYEILYKDDSLQTASKFIYFPNIKEYVIYHLDDSIYAELNERETTTELKTISATINNSLYQTILDHNASPLLVSKLVDVFAWQVDFFRIDKGDQFTVIYEEEHINGETVDIGKIQAAYFNHRQKEYYAIPYQVDGKEEYFDKEGKSLRKTFLRAPLNYSRISSRFSLRRFHPVQKRYKAHLGTDYAAPTGTPIRTVGDGVVTAATYHSGNGNYVKIRHNSTFSTQYLHMSKIKSGIKKGIKVKQGQIIGFVGSTGLATGPHLCFRFWKNGRQVDALKVDLPSVEGIPVNELQDFKILSNLVLKKLDSLNNKQKNQELILISDNSVDID